MTDTTRFDKATTLAFIGAGYVGGSLAIALANAGYPVVAVASRTFASAQTVADRIAGCTAVESIADAANRAQFVFITTPDDAIGPTSESISWTQGQGVAHCSGAASLDIFDPATRKGASAGAFHPLQSFNSIDNGVQSVPGTTFGIEGEAAMQGYLSEMALAIGGNPILLKPEDKVLYHTSGVLMGNLLAVLGSVASRIWERFDHPTDEGAKALAPMMKAVATNLETSGVPGVIAGPYPRGDIGTIRKHLDALSADVPEYLPLYCELALAGLPFAVEKGSLDPERAREIEALVNRFKTRQASKQTA
mgnify:FL=1